MKIDILKKLLLKVRRFLTRPASLKASRDGFGMTGLVVVLVEKCEKQVRNCAPLLALFDTLKIIAVIPNPCGVACGQANG